MQVRVPHPLLQVRARNLQSLHGQAGNKQDERAKQNTAVTRGEVVNQTDCAPSKGIQMGSCNTVWEPNKICLQATFVHSPLTLFPFIAIFKNFNFC